MGGKESGGMKQRHLFQPSIEDRFQEYRARHPEVYSALVRYALDAKHAGHRVGIKACWERVRWEMRVERRTDEEYLLNNSFTAHYARLIAQQEPELRDFFEMRRLRAL